MSSSPTAYRQIEDSEDLVPIDDAGLAIVFDTGTHRFQVFVENGQLVVGTMGSKDLVVKPHDGSEIRVTAS